MSTALDTAPADDAAFDGTAFDGTAARALRPRFDSEDFFGQQPTSTQALPDPAPLLENLTRCVIEILAGARELEQIARWLSDDVYRHLLKRKVQIGRPSIPYRRLRPNFSVGSIFACEPDDGVVEAAVSVHGRARSRVVAIRLEGIDHRWRATVIRLL